MAKPTPYETLRASINGRRGDAMSALEGALEQLTAEDGDDELAVELIRDALSDAQRLPRMVAKLEAMGDQALKSAAADEARRFPSIQEMVANEPGDEIELATGEPLLGDEDLEI